MPQLMEERPPADIRALMIRLRPLFLRAAVILRVGALVVASRLLLDGDVLGIVIAVWLAGTAIGLFWRRIWTWRLALIGDVVMVVAGALTLLEAGDLRLFSYIAGAAVIDVVLLGVGQAALDPGQPVP
jgi:hypothetical protein